MTQTVNITESEAVASFLEARSEVSFAPLFEILYPKVLCYFVVRGTPLATAEELAQDVLTAVYLHSAALRDRQLFFGWLFRIARNQLLQRVRKDRRDSNMIAIEDLDPNYARVAHSFELPAAGELRDWLECLEPQERQIMMLRYIEELGYQEIATALDLPLGTVKWKIFNAKGKLGENLKAARQT